MWKKTVEWRTILIDTRCSTPCGFPATPELNQNLETNPLRKASLFSDIRLNGSGI
jgi:hypothetical protein